MDGAFGCCLLIFSLFNHQEEQLQMRTHGVALNGDKNK
jgi:hypothetical protein